MSNNEAYLREIRVKAGEDRTFFRGDREHQGARERVTVGAFLRHMGVAFSDASIVGVCQEDQPPDVGFDGCRFEICEVQDPDRRRGDELKKRSKAVGVQEVVERYHPPSRAAWCEVIAAVECELAEKWTKYAGQCNNLDALVYVNYRDKVIDVKSDIPSSPTLTQQGWRSVAVVSNTCAAVLAANESAPVLLQQAVGRPRSEWKNPDTLWSPPASPRE